MEFTTGLMSLDTALNEMLSRVTPLTAQETLPLVQCFGRILASALNSIDGLSAVKPKAAFYIFPKIDAKRFNITNDEQFVLDFLREKKILLVHGGGFHWEQPDHFRIVYLPKLEDLEYSMNEMRDFLKDYKQK